MFHLLCLIALIGKATAAETPPDVPDAREPRIIIAPGVRFDLFVEHPDIVASTGIDVDSHAC